MKKVLFLIISILYTYALTPLEKANKFFSEKKYNEAYKIYKEYNNSIIAQNNLAMMYYYGYGVPFNQSKAVEILQELLNNKKLTDKQKSVVLYNLAMIYYYGYVDNNTNKLIVNRKKTEMLLKKSMKLKYKPAEIFYKNIYEKIKNKNKEINASKKK
jgi:hypothetical protein